MKLENITYFFQVKHGNKKTSSTTSIMLYSMSLILFTGIILTKKGAPPGVCLFITVVSCKEKFQSTISHQKILFGLRQTKGVNDYENNICVACVSNSPKNLIYTTFYDSNVTDRLEQFSSSDLTLISGDFNSRTGTEPDYITEDTHDLNSLPGDHEFDPAMPLKTNNNVHKTNNDSSKSA